MDQLISEGDDLRQLWNSCRHHWGCLRQLVKCFANDFEFTLYRRLDQCVLYVLPSIHSGSECLNSQG